MEHIGDSLQSYFNKTGLHKQLQNQNLLDTWYNVVGKHVGKYTRPVNIKETQLVVEVKDSSWLYHLTLLKPKIIHDFNAAVGEEIITDLHFRNVDFASETVKKKVDVEKKYDRNITGKKTFFPDKVVLNPEEENAIDFFLIYSPEPFQDTVKSLMRKAYLNQQWKKEHGALKCSICGFPFFKQEMKGYLCFLCHSQVKSWRKPINRVLHHRPWMNFKQICFIFPNLEVKIFNICRDLILSRYADRIRTLFSRADLDDQTKKKGLFRLVQRYVMILEEKEPFEIKQENIYKALKSFPGLYQFLYPDKS